MNLLPIGSVLQRTDKKLIVVGYHSETKDDKFTYSYIVSGYPIGFVEADSLATIPVDAEVEVIFKGYETDEFFKFIKNKQKSYELLKDMSVEECNAMIEEVVKAIEKEMEVRENG